MILQANGSTEMLSGIRTAINFPAPAGRLRSVVLLTDGCIGNENEIVAKEVEFSLSVDSEEMEQDEISAAISHNLEFISITGLDEIGIADLTQHLQQLNLPSGFSGEIVFEFTVNKSRVRQVVLDEKTSTVKDAVVVEKIKRSLVLWRVPPSTTGKVVLTLQIHT
ncbi:MAG: after-VIT domain-containing protein [Nostoc sp.]|uniref:after-VIT domain-containing protein n=1 Tax=Nostoc sp. TaxID=1180 RepID=UPI002FFCD713